MNPIDPGPPPNERWKADTYAKTQTDTYIPLPALIERSPNGRVVTRWKPTPEELELLLAGDDLCLEIFTFGNRLQPVRLRCWSNVVSCVDGSIGE